MINYFLLIIMTMMGSLGGFFLSKSTSIGGIAYIIKSKSFYIGGLLYFLSALINIYLLKIIPYTIILPLTSITYVWSFILSYKFLKEKITYRKIIGISFIIIGALSLGIAQGVV